MKNDSSLAGALREVQALIADQFNGSVKLPGAVMACTPGSAETVQHVRPSGASQEQTIARILHIRGQRTTVSVTLHVHEGAVKRYEVHRCLPIGGSVELCEDVG